MCAVEGAGRAGEPSRRKLVKEGDKSMRFVRFRALALTLATLALIAPITGAVAQSNNQPLVVAYRDGDGSGRMSILDVGADAATGGRQIKVQLQQNGVTYSGSGLSYQLEQQMPFKTLITFTLVSPGGRSYFFQGTTISGITFSGQGNYHRVGFPEQKFNWNFVLGG
jgi:hypothetical protein